MALEITQRFLPAGKNWVDQRVVEPITVQFFEGCVAFEADGSTCELAAGKMVYFASVELLALRVSKFLSYSSPKSSASSSALMDRPPNCKKHRRQYN